MAPATTSLPTESVPLEQLDKRPDDPAIVITYPQVHVDDVASRELKM
jgi:hypothetical protein